MMTHYVYEVIRKMIKHPEKFKFEIEGTIRSIYYNKHSIGNVYISCGTMMPFPENISTEEFKRLWKMKDYCDAMMIRNMRVSYRF